MPTEWADYDALGRIISDGVASHSIAVANDGTVSGVVRLGALSAKRADATKIVVEKAKSPQKPKYVGYNQQADHLNKGITTIR